MKWWFVLLLFAIVACKAESSNDSNGDNQTEKRIDQSKTEQVETNESVPDVEEEVETENGDLDSIKRVLDLWNTSINEKDYATLDQLYHGKLKFYLKDYTKEGVIDSKKNWLEKHPDYKQELSSLSIEYPTQEGQDGIIRCRFYKAFSSGNDKDTVDAFLELKHIENEYLIIKESDQPTEMKSIELESTGALTDVNATYTFEYWLDTREDNALGHDFVPYYASLSFDEDGEADFRTYSGSMREVTYYALKDFFQEDGYFSFKGAPMWIGDNNFESDEEDREFDEKDFQTFRFKILQNGIALIYTDGWHGDLEGCRFWKISH